MDEDIRNIARKRIKAKRDFWNLVLVFIIIAAIINAIWFFTGPTDYYWPMWPMLGFAIAIFFTALSAYGPGNKHISDEQIDREIRKMKGE